MTHNYHLYAREYKTPAQINTMNGRLYPIDPLSATRDIEIYLYGMYHSPLRYGPNDQVLHHLNSTKIYFGGKSPVTRPWT